MNKLLAANNAERKVMEEVKVKILSAIKHHVKKGYSNRVITMDKQHSYHIINHDDFYVLYDALLLLNNEFKLNNVPITIGRCYRSSEEDNFGAFDMAISFTINK